MKSFFIAILFFLPFSIIAQTSHTIKKNIAEPKVKQFWFVMLTKGQNRKTGFSHSRKHSERASE